MVQGDVEPRAPQLPQGAQGHLVDDGQCCGRGPLHHSRCRLGNASLRPKEHEVQLDGRCMQLLGCHLDWALVDRWRRAQLLDLAEQEVDANHDGRAGQPLYLCHPTGRCFPPPRRLHRGSDTGRGLAAGVVHPKKPDRFHKQCIHEYGRDRSREHSVHVHRPTGRLHGRQRSAREDQWLRPGARGRSEQRSLLPGEGPTTHVEPAGVHAGAASGSACTGEYEDLLLVDELLDRLPGRH
mmetsp:Transcript_57325/g.166398  ORF Transcript_57325/g.166398 Transcript_57325/m.166398 type:complete len:238 (-) Transcript_57325:293-1006(-)